MIDPRRAAVRLLDRKSGQFRDKTREVSQCEPGPGGTVDVVFNSGRRYSYGASNAHLLTATEHTAIGGNVLVEVNGDTWESAHEVVTFSGAGDRWSRVFYRARGGERYRTYPAAQVRVLDCAPPAGTATAVLSYWKAVVSGLRENDPLIKAHDKLEPIRPDSALRSYLTGSPVQAREGNPPIFPFRCNLSQREAVEKGLSHDISVIEGPPGTGKTATILNLIANIVLERGTVAVVSHTNAAVDNVREKLEELELGHVIANLGRKDKREAFFAEQDARNARVTAFAATTPEEPDLDRFTTVDSRLRRLQSTERRRAERQQEVEAYRLEQRHFERNLRPDELPDLDGLPLLRRSSERVLQYLAETHGDSSRRGLLRRIRDYFKYGSLRGLDPEDTDAVLRLQRAYYDKRIAELDDELERLDRELGRADFEQLADEHEDLSLQRLRGELRARYRGRSLPTYSDQDYKRTFPEFLTDYPVVLSTCHSLRGNLPRGFLLDYLIIDEASQTDPLVAGLALACCRKLVVVGDAQQLPPIPPDSAADHVPPTSAYDCRKSVLESLRDVHGDDALPRTLLREHYRCDPAIIGFCNKKFYGGELIPYTERGAAGPMVVVRTVEGNHMRQHREGGRSNQREVDVIANEVLAQHCDGIADEDIGITTPYRQQVSKASDVLDNVDTVHKFQGRQKEAVVLTTVVDETWRGRTGLPFVDDPRLINVAVSRAIRRFVLVTNHDTMPKSRHVRDLVGHIRYLSPEDGLVDSAVVSIFDLLYQDFSRHLRSLNKRIKNRTAHRSENIAWTVLLDVLGEPDHPHLTAAPQVLVDLLIPDRTRLTKRQDVLVRHRASVDFVVYNRVTNQPLLAIEVDGFKYHEDNPAQRERDAVKDAIFRDHGLPLLRLPTTGSGEQDRIRRALRDAEAGSTTPAR